MAITKVTSALLNSTALTSKAFGTSSIMIGDDATGTIDAANYNVGQYTAAWTDAATARKAVRYETRIEFAMEGHRFFDLQRWGSMGTTINEYLSRESRYRIYLQGKSFTSPKNEYYPVPQRAIDRSFVEGSASLTQDPNY